MAKDVAKHIGRKKVERAENIANRSARTGAGRRRLSLTAPEREALALNRMTEEAVAMFLDLETDRSNQEIANALGISKDQLKRLTQTEAFIEKYEAALIDIGHSPRLAAVKEGLDELFPLALRTIRGLMADQQAPAGVRLKAATEVLGYADLKSLAGGDQIREFENFLSGLGVKQDGRILISLPPEYASAMREFAAAPGGNRTDTSGAESRTRTLLQGGAEEPLVIDADALPSAPAAQ